jgi:guanylate kinase
METAAITGHIILVMGPTGSGKGSIVRYLREQFPELRYSISCTTRAMRPGEVDGVDYYFLTNEAFDHKIEDDAFVEWAEFGGNRYGTLKSELLARLEQGEVVITEIELQGVLQLERIIPPEHRTILFIDAGGWDVLKARALSRAPMSEEELELRYERYLHEVRAKPLAQHVINNTDGQLEAANQKVAAIVRNIIERTALATSD